MAIACRCPACRADLGVAEKLAGRKVKCPKCAGTVVVPPGEALEELPRAKPLSPRGAEVIADRQQGEADAAAEGFPNIVVDTSAGPAASRTGGRKTPPKVAGKKTRRPVWLVASYVSAAVLAVVVVLVLIDRLGGGWLTSWFEERSFLVLDWPESERSEAAVFIDNRKQELPRSGPVEFTVKPGPHRIVMLRRGYKQVETMISLKKDERHRYKPRWTELAAAAFDPETW